MSKQYDPPITDTLLFTPFLLQARVGLVQIATAQRALLASYQQFNEDPSPRPVHCDQAVATVCALRDPVLYLCTTLRQAEQLPSGVTPHRYSLLSVLSYVDEQTCVIVPMITRFRPICREGSSQSNQQRVAILRRLDILIQASDTIPSRVFALLERVQTTIPPKMILAS